MASTFIKIPQEDGTFLEFKKERIKARVLKELFKKEIEWSKLANAGKYAESLDLRIKFVVDLFNNPKLTTDMILDSIESEEIIPLLDRISMDIAGGDETKKGN